MKIMSVDDSTLIRRVVRGAAETLGYEFEEAKDGQEALDKLEELGGKVDLVLLDWNMPRLDGLSVLKKMKENEKWSAIPVTMVTTEVDKSKVVQAVEAGATNYLMKPFSQEDLISKIMQSLGQGV